MPSLRSLAVGIITLVLSALALAAILAPYMAQSPDAARGPVRKLSTANGNGSGVMVAPGFVLTAQHVAVVPDLVLRKNGVKGKVLATGDSEQVDLGLLHYPSQFAQCPCARLARYEAQPNEPIYVVGYPYGIMQTLSPGVAQGVVPSVIVPGAFGTEQVLGPRLVFAAAIGPGNSGGGVFVLRDGEFQLVGIVVEMAGEFGMAIPLVSIKTFLSAYL